MYESLKQESEVLQISIYVDIIKQILSMHEKLSVNKIIVFTYLLKKPENKIYNAKNTQDVIYKCLSILSGCFDNYCDSIEYIIKALHILIINQEIENKDNILSCKNKLPLNKITYLKNSFMYKAIEESKKLTDRQFLKEVVGNV